MKIRTKITAVGIFFTVATASLITGILAFRQQGMTREIHNLQGDVHTMDAMIAGQIRERTLSEFETIDRVCGKLIDSLDQSAALQLKHSQGVAKEQLDALGPIRFGPESVTWKSVNQLTNAASTIELPRMSAGAEWLGQNDDAGKPSPVVDIVRHKTNDYCTVFQRMNDAGDMIRVCTSVLKTDGSRAIGTFIPRYNPDRTENPVLEKVLKGESYRGRAFVVNEWHEAVYEPLFDASLKKVVGMLYVGTSVTESEAYLRDAMMNITVGKTGRMFVLGTIGKERGTYLLSPGGKRNGENAWAATDADGRFFVQEMIEKARSAPQGAPVLIKYPWTEESQAKPRTIIAMISYEPRGWVIGAGCYEEELIEAQRGVETSTSGMLATVQLAVEEMKKAQWLVIGAGLLLSMVAAIFGSWLSSGICRPISEAARLLDGLANGDLTQSVRDGDRAQISQVKPTDEIGVLRFALTKMVANLRNVVTKVIAAADTVAAGSEEMSATAQQLAEGASKQSAAAEESTSAMEQMTSSIRQNGDNARTTEKIAAKAADDAKSSGEVVARTVAAIKEIAGKINIIEEIARKTDLLALNAAVEAARAGEHGRGFAVVASEVRKLAERSANAAAEISRLSRNGVSTAEGAGDMLLKLAPEIRKTAELVQEINAASADQSAGVGRINSSLQALDQVTQQNASAAEEMASTSEELSSQAQHLQTAISFFKVDNNSGTTKRSSPLAAHARGKAALASNGHGDAHARAGSGNRNS